MLIGLSLPFLSLICIADEPDDVFNQSNPCNHIHTTNKTSFLQAKRPHSLVSCRKYRKTKSNGSIIAQIMMPESCLDVIIDVSDVQ